MGARHVWVFVASRLMASPAARALGCDLRQRAHGSSVHHNMSSINKTRAGMWGPEPFVEEMNSAESAAAGRPDGTALLHTVVAPTQKTDAS